MARTFTGLKLQGQLGKFGKKEISDIEGYVELPDGKVLSGSEWGNMLLWDGGLIKVEICRKNKKPCHQGSIQQIIMDEGELMTIGNDGYIRVSQQFSCYVAVILLLAFMMIIYNGTVLNGTNERIRSWKRHTMAMTVLSSLIIIYDDYL